MPEPLAGSSAADTPAQRVPQTAAPQTAVPQTSAAQTPLPPIASGALADLAEHLRGVSLPLPAPGAARARDGVVAARDQLADHLIPRLEAVDAPLLVVVGGSTGAGKSTIVNAFVGHPVTRAGAIRPTTRRPVLLHNPADAAWFEGSRILPGLSRVRGGGLEASAHAPIPAQSGPSAPGAPAAEAASTSVELLGLEAIPQGLALLDAPDIDSVSQGNRELARQLLRAADLWLFVTTANRYADAVPWEVLRSAAERDVTVAVVMNRIPPREGIKDELAGDLRAMLERNALDPAHLFLIEESPLSEDGMLPDGAVALIRDYFQSLAADAAARGAIARRTLAGAIEGLGGSVETIAASVEEQEEIRERLEGEIAEAFSEVEARIEQALGDGSLLRGEVLARWQDVVGTGEFFRSVETFVGRVRDRIGRALSGQAAPAVAAQDALETGLVHVVVDETASGAERVEQAWRADPAGRVLVEGQDLARMPDGYAQEVASAVRAWQGDVLELVRVEGADRRTKARVLSLGVNAVGVALMIAVFASTAFIPTGLEVGTGAAAAVVGQKLLETVFGEEAVRRLTRIAREQLAQRLTALVDSRTAPFRERLDALPAGTDAEVLREDADALLALAADIRAQAQGAARAVASDDTVEGERA